MITPDGQTLIFLTYDEIIQFSLKSMTILDRTTLAPLLFPFLKKMTVRKRNLLISGCGNKILGIICENEPKGLWYFLIYDVKNKSCQRRFLSGGGTRGHSSSNSFSKEDLRHEVNKNKYQNRVGEYVKEWITADGWKNFIFYKVEKSMFFNFYFILMYKFSNLLIFFQKF